MRVYRGRMERKTTIVEVCPECSSVDVLVAEPRWFSVQIDRRAVLETEPGIIAAPEFGCRHCGTRWD